MANIIRYAFGDSSLGPIVAAVSERGLAFLAFDAGVAELEARFPEADLVEDAAALQETIDRLADLIEHPEGDAGFTLDLAPVWNPLPSV